MILKFMFLLPLSLVSSINVNTDFGRIEGSVIPTKAGADLYIFKGIPYAKPPISENRFKEPQEFTGSYPNDILVAKRSTKCVHYSVKKDKVKGEEDCLHLNIYTTSLDSSSNYPVTFYIHGGDFVHGSGDEVSPESLFDFNKNMVFVSINYRLGPFGFLSTEDDVISGNMGLKDQVVALKWVKNHISKFGGNPNNIVLVGLSSGGACVHLHYLSPMSRGLFSKGISLGGAALSRFGFKDRHTKEGFKVLMTLFSDCRSEDHAQAIKCLSEKPAIDIIEALTNQQIEIPKEQKISNNFRPIVEKKGKNPFLNKHPYFLFEKKQIANVPWILGMTSEEGLFPAAEYLQDESKVETLDQQWNTMAPYLLQYVGYAENDDLDRISQEVRKHYFNTDKISLENKDVLIKLFGDRLHYVPLENSLRLHVSASRANTYMYMFAYKGKQSLTQVIYGTRNSLGVCHLDDSIYLFQLHNFKQIDHEEPIRRMMMNMWDSFLHEDSPNLGNSVKIPPVEKRTGYSGNIQYLEINTTPKLMSKPFLSDRVFWDSLNIDEIRLSGDPYIPAYLGGKRRQPKGMDNKTTDSKKTQQTLPQTTQSRQSFSLIAWLKKLFSWLNIFKKKPSTE